MNGIIDIGGPEVQGILLMTQRTTQQEARDLLMYVMTFLRACVEEALHADMLIMVLCLM